MQEATRSFLQALRGAVLPVLFGVVLCPGAALAEDDPCAVPGPALTAMQAGSLGQATHVLYGEIETVRSLRGRQIVRVRPIEWLKGRVSAGGPVTVLISGPRPTADRRRPSAVYLAEGTKGRHVYFLLMASGGVAFDLLTLFRADDDLGAEKLAAVRQHAALAQVPDPEERARQTLGWLLASQKADGTWTRVHAARELNHLAGVRPDLFDGDARAAVRAVLKRGALPAQRTWLTQLLQTLEGTGAVVPDAPTPGEAPPAAGLDAALATVETPEARIAVLREFLHRGGGWADVLARIAGEPEAVRLWVVTTLADGGYRGAAERIRSLYAFEDRPAVLAAIVRAVGLLGGATDVGWLAARRLNPHAQREALFALARIRTEAALAWLETARAEAVSSGAGDDMVALVDYLRSEVFAEVEAAAGRPVGPDRGP